MNQISDIELISLRSCTTSRGTFSLHFYSTIALFHLSGSYETNLIPQTYMSGVFCGNIYAHHSFQQYHFPSGKDKILARIFPSGNFGCTHAAVKSCLSCPLKGAEQSSRALWAVHCVQSSLWAWSSWFSVGSILLTLWGHQAGIIIQAPSLQRPHNHS